MVVAADNFLMRRATPIAIAVLTLLMASAGLVFYHQNNDVSFVRIWVNHSYEIKESIQKLQILLEDAAFGAHGYLLTGDERFLDPYKDATQDVKPPEIVNPDYIPDESDFLEQLKAESVDQRRSIAQAIDDLRKSTADDSTQQQNLDNVERTAGKFMAYLAAAIEARRSQADRHALPKADMRDGAEMMARLRDLLLVMTTEENHLLILRTQLDEAGTKKNLDLTLMGAVGFYLTMIGAICLYQRARQRAQAELLRYTQQLERSEEELKVQQEELKASNEEIESSNEELEEQNAQIRQQAVELEENKSLIEEKIRETELASKYKSEFLANMSHELRTPLNSLLILARSLAANEDKNLTEEQVEESRIIYNDGLELLNLINDILDLSKVEAGKLGIVAEEVGIDGIAKRLQQQFAPIAGQSNVAFLMEAEEGLPATLNTDAQRVEQILKNLLSNAFKFTAKGSVTLKIHRAALEREGAVGFSVIDTGIGIEKSKLKDIFEAFQQEDGSTDRHYGGTGLGLTIARKFAHLLGGEIRVASEKGSGSTFTLVLPVNLASDSVEETDAKTITPLKTMPRSSIAEFIPDDRRAIGDKDKTLLIIEDDRNFAHILMKIARKRGYKCLAAGDGKTGLLLAMEEPVTAIILDLKLPDIDGMQILDQLKHDLRSRHIPVHIISGRDENDTARSLRKGAIGYLTKPVEEERIADAFTKIETLVKADMKQILVVEDDGKNQAAIQSLLKKRDIRITTASTGAAALEQLASSLFDCVILDLRLPDMNGLEWLEKAENASGKKDLPPVIVYTAKDLTEDENRQINRYTGSIIIKGAKSPERLLDEVTLFLHSVESTLSSDQREMIRMQHNPDKVLQGRTVLLADDDLRNTFALSKLLKKHGMDVIIADNGQMALDKLKEIKKIDLVIMDIMMPVMDGYQAMRSIRAQKMYETIPVIALTARAMQEEQEKCMAAGANDYLTKPVDVERLLTLLRVWLFRQEMAA